MSLLPIFLKLDGRPGLLVGAGSVALDKLGSLLKTGLRLRVVAPEAKAEVRRLAAEGRLEWVQRPFQLSDLDGNYLVIAATNSAAVNSAVYQGAVERGILCNSVDDIPNCDFFFGSVVSRGELQIAISTAGESPAVAQRLRREIDEQLPEDLGPWLENLGRLRREVLAAHPRTEARRLLLHQLAQRPVCESASCPSRQIALAPIDKQNANSRGKVHLVGAGPGDPDLLTVKALRLIQSADVLLHDDLVPNAILDLARSGCEVVNVGKRCGVKNVTQEEINALMAEHARAHRRVVRLKSGDPLIFGRASEEIAALSLIARRRRRSFSRPATTRCRTINRHCRIGRTRRASSTCRDGICACWRLSGCRKASRPISPAPSSPAPPSQASRSTAPRSAPSAMLHRPTRPAC